jgi:ABC-2 type transport system permease protein
MKRIFEIELIKLRHGKTTKVIAIIYAAITILSLIILTYLYKSSVDMYQTYGGGEAENLSNFPPLSFPFVWLIGSVVSSILIIFPAILAVLNASNEFSSKIHRQHIIDGLSKDEYILSKFFSVLIISLSFTIYTAFLCIIMGLVHNTGAIPQEILDAMSNHVFRDTHPLIWLFGYFLYTLSILSFGLLISFIFKKTGRSIFAFVGYYLVLEWIILAFLVKWKLFLVAKLLPVWSVANNIFPNTITGAGINTAEMESNGTLDRLNEKDMLRDLFAFDFTDSLTAIIYIGIYFLLIRWIFSKRDL